MPGDYSVPIHKRRNDSRRNDRRRDNRASHPVGISPAEEFQVAKLFKFGIVSERFTRLNKLRMHRCLLIYSHFPHHKLKKNYCTIF